METNPPAGVPSQSPKSPAPGGSSPARPRPAPNAWIILIFLAILGAFYFYSSGTGNRVKVPYGFFWQQLEKGNIAQVELDGQTILGKFRTQPEEPPIPDEQVSEGRSSTKETSKQAAKPGATEKHPSPTAAARPKKLLPLEFITVGVGPPGENRQLNEELRKQAVSNGLIWNVKPAADDTLLVVLIYMIMPIVLIVAVWMMWRRARDQIMGGGILSGFSKSPAKRYEEAGKKTITFNDVAGLENVKNDLQEIVEFLKAPEKFTRLGGRVPKGVLLMGPPGTGKTLLARAVAGEAGVPFFSISGSEFIQMFVGVGASRVRDMFKTAKEASPCILFIDEIDAVGRHRGAGLGGGHDEREQTLNQILSEMDGFSQTEAVIVLAATNRPDVLDPALLRPGRFDRHITVDRPNQRARAAIFKVHTRDVPLANDVDIDRLAAGTVGLTGADIRNLVNEAALWATRNGKDKVDMDDFEYARDKVLMGPKREELLTGKEKRMTAYHESGHALLAWILPGVDRLHKVTIIPRGRALGVTQLLPEEDRLNIGQSELVSRLIFTLGGRAAEKLVFNEYSAGAESDLTQVTKLARRMVTHWGMSERIGPVAFRTSEEHPFLGREIHEQREFSEHTAQVIDEEVSRILHDADQRAMELLAQHREKLDALSAALEEREVLDEIEVEEILGPSPFPRASSNGRAVGKPTAKASS
ncbi:MAG: ATP-dependent zinc metalloprotease FtsH [Pirellulales bacterium]|nr:ATP-dependent zinc metalloprotease FtsH [Pirellulales bacterium]